MKVLNVESQSNAYESHIAWKVANRGKGLKKLVQLLTSEQLAPPQEVFDY